MQEFNLQVPQGPPGLLDSSTARIAQAASDTRREFHQLKSIVCSWANYVGQLVLRFVCTDLAVEPIQSPFANRTWEPRHRRGRTGDEGSPLPVTRNREGQPPTSTHPFVEDLRETPSEAATCPLFFPSACWSRTEGEGLWREFKLLLFCFPLRCNFFPSLENTDLGMKLLKHVLWGGGEAGARRCS